MVSLKKLYGESWQCNYVDLIKFDNSLGEVILRMT